MTTLPSSDPCSPRRPPTKRTRERRGTTNGEYHAILDGVDLESVPPILGYDVVEPREDAIVVARWEEAADPTLCVGEDRKTLAYAFDPVPHRGCGFVHWDDYDAFWANALAWCLDWRAGKAPATESST